MTITRSQFVYALALLAGLAAAPAASAQAASGASGAAPANAERTGNKAGKPPTDAAASQSNVATKKPAKQGAQSGPAPSPQK